MKEKNLIKIYVYKEKDNVQRLEHLKDIELPITLSDMDSFAVFLQKNCGNHTFHISFMSSYGRWMRLCMIRIRHDKKTGVSYRFKSQEDRQRTLRFIKDNFRGRDRLRLATGKSSMPDRKSSARQEDAWYYG